MTISKRMRFEILRRDNHTCRYCGQTAPDVKLAVDHVLPTALGGPDDPNNLVTACTDCNNGKTSTSPDSELVADIDNHALLMQAAYAKAVEARNKKRSHTGQKVSAALEYWEANARHYASAPSDAKASLRYFFKMGITLDDIEEAMDIAVGKRGIPEVARWRYFCGIVHNQMAELEQSAKAIYTADNPGARSTQPCGHCDECLEGDSADCLLIYELDVDEEPYSCRICKSQQCMYDIGHERGHQQGWREARARFEVTTHG